MHNSNAVLEADQALRDATSRVGRAIEALKLCDAELSAAQQEQAEAYDRIASIHRLPASAGASGFAMPAVILSAHPAPVPVHWYEGAANG